MRVEFRLSIPNVGSWNGKWSRGDNNYIIYRNLPKKKCLELGLKTTTDKEYWFYDFGDGCEWWEFKTLPQKPQVKQGRGGIAKLIF